MHDLLVRDPVDHALLRLTEKFAGVFGFFRSLANILSGRDDEYRQVIALAVLWIEDVIAETEAVRARLPAEAKGVDRLFAAGGEQLNRVAVALCEGRSISEYAASAGISVQTARTLLKRAQEKTDTHRQAELVSLLLRSSTLIRPGNLIGQC